MAYTVALANQKGGVGKTTSAVNIADAAARAGARVLLVDLDPQANATVITEALPVMSAPDVFGQRSAVTISDALYAARPTQEADPTHGTALRVAVGAGEYWPERLRVAPAAQSLAHRGDEGWPGAAGRLAIALDGAADVFDLIVIDVAPTLGVLLLAALHAADGVLLATEPADSSVRGLPLTLDLIATTRAAGGRAELAGLIATNVPARAARSAELLALLARDYGPLLWASVPRREVVRQAEGAHAPVSAFGASGAEVADAYRLVAGRLLDMAGIDTKERT